MKLNRVDENTQGIILRDKAKHNSDTGANIPGQEDLKMKAGEWARCVTQTKMGMR